MCHSLESFSRILIAWLVWYSSLGDILRPVVSFYCYDLGSLSLIKVSGAASLSEAYMSSLSMFGRPTCCAWSGMTGSGPDATSWGCILCVLYLLNPGSCYQWERLGKLTSVGCTVFKNFPCWTWNRGDTMAVSRLRISETELVCLGEGYI